MYMEITVFSLETCRKPRIKLISQLSMDIRKQMICAHKIKVHDILSVFINDAIIHDHLNLFTNRKSDSS